MAKVLITGTSKGIGYETTLLLARAGHEVIATMRNPSNCDLASVTAEEGLGVVVEAMDVDDENSVNDVMARYASSIDVLVNNAGIYSLNAVEDEPMSMFEAVMNTNFFGAVRCTKAVLPRMRERGAGCVINISSIAGKIATTPTSAYGASKHALEAFSEALAQEMRPFGGRVAIVEPGIISTAMATTELPEYKPDTLYSGGRRMTAIFRNAEQLAAPAGLVAGVIQYVIESGDDTLRYPVGPDALPFLGWRSSLSDEKFRDVLGADTDDEFVDQFARQTLIDLKPFM